MAGIDDSSTYAARIILGLAETPDADGDPVLESTHSLLTTFYSLAQLTPAREMPESVRYQVRERLSSTDPIPPDQPAARPTEESGRAAPSAVRFFRRFTRLHVRLPVTAVVMLTLALVLSIGANILLARSVTFRPVDALHLAGTGSAPDARGMILSDGKDIVLFASGLAELTSGYRYVAWRPSETGTLRLGTLTMLSATTARLLLSDQMLPGNVLITIEPGAAASEPTGPQILLGSAE